MPGVGLEGVCGWVAGGVLQKLRYPKPPSLHLELQLLGLVIVTRVLISFLGLDFCLHKSTMQSGEPKLGDTTHTHTHTNEETIVRQVCGFTWTGRRGQGSTAVFFFFGR
jgi:hypothetical protein